MSLPVNSISPEIALSNIRETRDIPAGPEAPPEAPPPYQRPTFRQQFYGDYGANTQVDIEDNENKDNLSQYSFIEITGNFGHHWRNSNLLGIYRACGHSHGRQVFKRFDSIGSEIYLYYYKKRNDPGNEYWAIGPSWRQWPFGCFSIYCYAAFRNETLDVTKPM